MSRATESLTDHHDDRQSTPPGTGAPYSCPRDASAPCARGRAHLAKHRPECAAKLDESSWGTCTETAVIVEDQEEHVAIDVRRGAVLNIC